MAHELETLSAQAALQEYEFRSDTPLIGSLLARLRAAWHSAAGKWADRFIVQQQSAFNAGTVAQLQVMTLELNDMDERVVMDDHDLTDLTRSVAELTQQVIQLQQAVADLQARHSDRITVHE